MSPKGLNFITGAPNFVGLHVELDISETSVHLYQTAGSHILHVTHLQLFFVYLNDTTLPRCSALICSVYLFVFGATAPPVGQGLLVHEVSRSHTATQHSR